MASARDIAALREAMPNGISGAELEKMVDSGQYPLHIASGYATLDDEGV